MLFAFPWLPLFKIKLILYVWVLFHLIHLHKTLVWAQQHLVQTGVPDHAPKPCRFPTIASPGFPARMFSASNHWRWNSYTFPWLRVWRPPRLHPPSLHARPLTDSLNPPLLTTTTPTPSLQPARLYTYTPDRPHVLRICRHAGPGSIHFEWRKQFRVDTMNESPTTWTHRFIWQASLVQPSTTSTAEKTRIVGLSDRSQPSMYSRFIQHYRRGTASATGVLGEARESFCEGLQQRRGGGGGSCLSLPSSPSPACVLLRASHAAGAQGSPSSLLLLSDCIVRLGSRSSNLRG